MANEDSLKTLLTKFITDTEIRLAKLSENVGQITATVTDTEKRLAKLSDLDQITATVTEIKTITEGAKSVANQVQNDMQVIKTHTTTINTELGKTQQKMLHFRLGRIIIIFVCIALLIGLALATPFYIVLESRHALNAYTLLTKADVTRTIHLSPPNGAITKLEDSAFAHVTTVAVPSATVLTNSMLIAVPRYVETWKPLVISRSPIVQPAIGEPVKLQGVDDSGQTSSTPVSGQALVVKVDTTSVVVMVPPDEEKKANEHLSPGKDRRLTIERCGLQPVVVEGSLQLVSKRACPP
jgi:hypothetical protein